MGHPTFRRIKLCLQLRNSLLIDCKLSSYSFLLPKQEETQSLDAESNRPSGTATPTPTSSTLVAVVLPLPSLQLVVTVAVASSDVVKMTVAKIGIEDVVLAVEPSVRLRIAMA